MQGWPWVNIGLRCWRMFTWEPDKSARSCLVSSGISVWSGSGRSQPLIQGGFAPMIVQGSAPWELRRGVSINNQDGCLSPKTRLSVFHSARIPAETGGSPTLKWPCEPSYWHVNTCPVCLSSSLPSHVDVSYEDFLVALQRYSTCEQRQGKWWETQPAPPPSENTWPEGGGLGGAPDRDAPIVSRLLCSIPFIAFHRGGKRTLQRIETSSQTSVFIHHLPPSINLRFFCDFYSKLSRRSLCIKEMNNAKFLHFLMSLIISDCCDKLLSHIIKSFD